MPYDQIIKSYYKRLVSAANWIGFSERPSGGSSAQYTPAIGWSKSYPETTGYLIPTLLNVAKKTGDRSHSARAYRFGEWLLAIQNSDGSWNGGQYPNRAPKPSIFNTGQILKGLVSLSRDSGDKIWLDAAERGARWLVDGLGPDYLWKGGDYLSNTTPSYYIHVFWPILEVYSLRPSSKILIPTSKGVRALAERRLHNGVISGWSFENSKPAFTHTIAYTIRGFQECGRILDDPYLFNCIDEALDILMRRSELRGGALPGSFDENWQVGGDFVCLTGNLQIAKCLLIREEKSPDLRLVNAAARMIDYVCKKQQLYSPVHGLRGGIPGSSPFCGPYMSMRYPNWAAKYFCDAIMALLDRVSKEV